MTATSLSAGQCPFSNASEDFKPFDLADPFPFYQWARTNEPVFYAEKLGYYVVSRHDDVKAVFENWQTFSSENAQAPVRPFGEDARRVMREGGFTAYSGLSARIPPDHTRIRRALHRCFGPKRFQAIEPQIREIVATAIDAFEARGEVDFHKEFAYDVPALALFRLVGVPDEDVARVKAWGASRALLTWGELSDEAQVPHAHAMVEYWRYCREIVRKRHENATDDLPGDLVRLQQAGDPIDDDEIAGVLYSILFAGHETTTNLMSNSLRELLKRPAEWDRLVADPSLAMNAVDECLRFAPSVIVWRRRALADTEIRGVKIPRGANILLLQGSANRDEAVFADGESFDVNRTNADQHMSFGFGIHNCVGRQLARLELSIALQELGRRLPGLKLVADQPFEFMRIVSFRSPKALLVTWDRPAKAHAA